MFDLGIDISNWGGGNIPASAFAQARDDHGIKFVRVGAQDPHTTRLQLNAIREAGGIDVDVLYVTTPFQVDGALQLAGEFGVPSIAVDVEDDCFTLQEEIDSAIARIEGAGFEARNYTRVSYWQPGGYHIDPRIKTWDAWYLGSSIDPSDDTMGYVADLCAAAGLGPLECWQYQGTIELVPGLTCDLNARLSLASSEAGPVSTPAVAPASGPGDGPATPGPAPYVAPNPDVTDFQPVEPTAIINGQPYYGPTTPAPAENYDDAPGGFRLTQELPYAYLEFCGVGVVRFGSEEKDDAGQPLYPGRMAFLRGDTYYYMRAREDGTLYLSTVEGE